MNCRSDVSPTQSPCMREEPTNRFSISTPLFSLSDKRRNITIGGRPHTMADIATQEFPAKTEPLGRVWPFVNCPSL